MLHDPRPVAIAEADADVGAGVEPVVGVAVAALNTERYKRTKAASAFIWKSVTDAIPQEN